MSAIRPTGSQGYYNEVQFCGGLYVWPKKEGFVNWSVQLFQFCQKNALGNKIQSSTYMNATLIVRAYHLEHQYFDVYNLGLGLPCSAMWLNFRVTLYGPSFNVETFWFC